MKNITMNFLNRKGYVCPEVRVAFVECASELLQSSVIKITAVEGVTVAPWDDVVPENADPKPGADHSFDVTFE